MKKLLFISFITLLALSSCQNEDEGQSGDLTTDEAKALVENSGTSLSNDIVSLVESDGIKSLIHFANLIEGSSVLNGRVSQKAWTKERLNLIIQYFVNGPSARVGNNEGPATFDEIKGLYTWNFELQEFEKEASDFLIVRFPSEGSESNNAEFKVSNLIYVTVTETDGDGGLVSELITPSEIEAYLKVNEITLVEIDYLVNWSSIGYPEKANVSLFVKPFDFIISFDDTFATSASLLTSVSIEDELIVGIDLDVKFESESKEDPYLFEGYVQYRDLKIQGNIDARKIGINADPNQFIDLTLYSTDSKIGDIVFELEEVDGGLEDYIPYVQHADGSLQNLEEILTPVFEEIEAIFTEFEE